MFWFDVISFLADPLSLRRSGKGLTQIKQTDNTWVHPRGLGLDQTHLLKADYDMFLAPRRGHIN